MLRRSWSLRFNICNVWVRIWQPVSLNLLRAVDCTYTIIFHYNPTQDIVNSLECEKSTIQLAQIPKVSVFICDNFPVYRYFLEGSRVYCKDRMRQVPPNLLVLFDFFISYFEPCMRGIADI